MTAPLARRHLFGLDFIDAPDVTSVADALLDDTAVAAALERIDGRLPVVVTPNVDHLVRLDRQADAVAARIVSGAAFVLPDGQPIVWASGWLGAPLRARLPGSSLVGELWPRLVDAGTRVAVVATSHEVASAVEGDSPAALAVVAPQLDLADRDAFDSFVADVADRIAAHRAELVFVTLGFPKQCNIIDGVLARWPSDLPPPLCFAVGASFDMRYGIVKRAPDWVQRIGMEWFFRFVQEPRRLFKRYFVDDLHFARMVARERRARRSPDAAAAAERHG